MAGAGGGREAGAAAREPPEPAFMTRAERGREAARLARAAAARLAGFSAADVAAALRKAAEIVAARAVCPAPGAIPDDEPGGEGAAAGPGREG